MGEPPLRGQISQSTLGDMPSPTRPGLVRSEDRAVPDVRSMHPPPSSPTLLDRFEAQVLYRDRLRAGVGVQTTLQTSSDALLGGATTTLN
jgi:hypothetical protein